MPHILLLKLRSVQTLWLFQLTMPHLSTVDREIPTWILKIGMHSFKSHCFSQVLKITVYFKLSSPPPCAKGGGGKTPPKTKQNLSQPTHECTQAHKRALIFKSFSSSECELPLSAQFLTSSRSRWCCTEIPHHSGHRATLGCQLTWLCCHTYTYSYLKQ